MLQIDSLVASCETWSICCIIIIVAACLCPLPVLATRHRCPADWCVWVGVCRLEYQDCGRKSSTATVSCSVQQQQHYSDASPESPLVRDPGQETTLSMQKEQRGIRSSAIHQADLGHVVFANNSLSACTCFNPLELQSRVCFLSVPHVTMWMFMANLSTIRKRKSPIKHFKHATTKAQRDMWSPFWPMAKITDWS